MAEGSALGLYRGQAAICLPIEEDEYNVIVETPEAFRQSLHRYDTQMPEVFPEGFDRGYAMKDGRTSVKQGVSIRRIVLRDGSSYSIRPSFLMPYMTARTEEVEGPLFLRKFGVPFWALARLFGGDPMRWYRLEIGLGRNSLVGTTVRKTELPEHLLADEHHLHGSRNACDQHFRAWALLHNFTPWHPATANANNGWQSPVERLNRHRYLTTGPKTC